VNTSANQTRAVNRSAALAELIDRLTDRAQAGERLHLERLLAEYPEHADELRQLLPAVGLLGELSRTPGAATAAAPLGPAAADGTLGDFRIVREVGRGGMGVVYEAEQISLRRRVALKVLPFAAVADPRSLQRFRNEALAAAGLDHPHVVKVYGVGCERGVHFIALQYIDGRPLSEFIRERRGQPAEPPTATAAADATATYTPGRTAPAKAKGTTSNTPRGDAAYYHRVAEWGAQAADALEHAHALGVVHRDVKPANLLVDGAGKVYVADFGLAKLAADPGVTGTGDLLGTVRYMSPEQANARHDLVDHRSDVYSLGVTLYELLALTPAFTGADRQAVLTAVLSSDPAGLRSHDRGIPRDLETVVQKAMDKDPARRYPTAGEFAADLRRFLGSRNILARRMSVRERLGRWVGRHPRAVLTVTGVVILLAGGAAYAQQEHTRAIAAATRDADEADKLLEARRYRDAVLAARRAETARPWVGGAGLQTRAERLIADGELGTALEAARLDQFQLRGDGGAFDLMQAVPRYEQAFRAFGVDPLTDDEPGVTDRLRESAVRAEAAAALDDWATLTTDATQRARLERLADAIGDDRDDLLARARKAVRANDAAELKRLLATAQADPPPPAVVVRVAAALPMTPWADPIPLLRATQLRHPNDLWVNYHLAQRLFLADGERFAGEAVEHFRAALALRPDAAGVWANPSAALNSARRYPEGEWAARRALELNSQNSIGHYNLGYSLYKQRRDPEALKAARQAHTLGPDWKTHYLLGVCLIRATDWAAAEAELRQVVELNPDHAESHRWLGVALTKLGRLPDAATALEKAAKLDPSDAATQFDLGTVRLKQNKLEAAEAALVRATELKPDYTDAWVNLGLTYRHRAKPDQAEAAYRKALNIDPKLAAARSNLAILFATQGRIADAEKEFRQVTEDRPKLASAHREVAKCYLQQKKWTEFERSIGRAIDLEPGSADDFCTLGHGLREQKKYGEALAAFQRGQELGRQRAELQRQTAKWIKETEALIAKQSKSEAKQPLERLPPPRPDK
jgi:serine/threonine protein kinase/Flp pilus assembly protein TadD